MPFRKSLCILQIILSLFGSISWAQESKIPQILAVQSRPYWLRHELVANVGYWPLDHFNTYISGGGSYAYYFNDYIAWEVVNSQWHTNSATGLQSYLDKTFAAQPETFDILKNSLTSNFIYTPFYLKSVFAGRSIVWGDISLVAGFGISQFDGLKNVRTFDFGALVRFMLGEKWSLKVDLRSYNFLEASLKPNIQIGLGIAFNFGSDRSAESGRTDLQEDL